jgi:pimeloyl-ACP methyl ester carboxylesterase
MNLSRLKAASHFLEAFIAALKRKASSVVTKTEQGLREATCYEDAFFVRYVRQVDRSGRSVKNARSKKKRSNPMANPIILLHGYASDGEAFSTFRDVLQQSGRAVTDIFIGNYVTLNNEITVDDIAEGFNYSLRANNLFGKPFDAIVHSTGMLVMRAWLTAPNALVSRKGLLKRLIALAPATFGSPIAAKGRSLLGRIFIGSKEPGPDFLVSGNLVLSNLELGSEYTWNLAHKDMIDEQYYGPDKSTPYVFVFDGTSDYGTLAEIFDADDQKGSDGVVRWSGVALNTRKITLDLSHPENQVQWSDWSGIDIPIIPIAGVNHNQILAKPPQGLVDLVLKALTVDSEQSFKQFHEVDVANTQVVKDGRAKIDADPWQQFVVHARDSHGNAVVDYAVSIVATQDGQYLGELGNFEEDVHPFAADPSYRCFHVNLKDYEQNLQGKKLAIRIVASTGTDMVGYQGYGSGYTTGLEPTIGPVDIDISRYQDQNPGQPSLFCPFTTTLVEIILNRAPMPQTGKTTLEIFGFIGAQGT